MHILDIMGVMGVKDNRHLAKQQLRRYSLGVLSVLSWVCFGCAVM